MKNFQITFLNILLLCYIASCSTKVDTKNEQTDAENLLKSKDLSELDPPELLSLAKEEYSKGNSELAMKALNKRLSSTFDDETYSLKGDIHFAKGEFDNANESYKRCRISNPNNTYCLLNLAKIQQYLGNFDKAITLLDSALFIEKTLSKAYFLKGLSFELRGFDGDLDLAISSYQTSIELDNSEYDGYMRLGDIYAKKQDDLAIEYYNSASKTSPERVDSYYNLAIYYQNSERYTKAFEVYDKMIQADENSFLAYHNQGYILLVFSDEFEEAVEKFSKCLEINPNYLEAYHNRGLSYKNMGKYKNARTDFKQALLLNPDSELSARELSELDKFN